VTKLKGISVSPRKSSRVFKENNNNI